MRELNLLPPARRALQRQEQQFLLWGDILKGVVISLTIVTSAGVILGLGFWIMIQSVPRLSELPQQIKQYQQVRAATAERNAVVDTLTQISTDHIVWTPLITTIVSIMNPDIKLDQITAESVTKKITITGRAASRNSLIVLEERLEAIPGVQSVTAPPSNLLIRQNPPFSFEIFLDPTKL